MRYVMRDEKEIKLAVDKLRNKIKEEFREIKKNAKLIFPGGGETIGTIYSTETSYGKLFIMIPNQKLWNNRVPHLVNLNSINKKSPDVEINIPLKLDRRVSTCVVKDVNDFLICSRGKLTVYKSAIPKNLTMNYFNKWIIDVYDGDKKIELIPIAALSSPNLSELIAQYVKQVQSIKQEFKKSKLNKKIKNNKKWGESREFEGNIKRNIKKEVINYEYLHGPICNGLKDYLKEKIINFEICSTENIDCAIFYKNEAKVIFEVKTSLNFSDQIYKGIGQLLCYKVEDGSKNTKLFLVLPYLSKKDNNLSLLKEVLKSLDINLIFWEKNNKFRDDKNQELFYLLKHFLE